MKLVTIGITVLLILSLLIGIYLKKKLVVFLSIFGIIAFVIYTFYFKKLTFQFLFIDDEDNVEEAPEIYCGDDENIPDEYDVIGSRNRCLKKGVGVGMTMSNEARETFMEKPRPLDDGVRKYCGDNEDLPETYTEFGSRMDCMKKGVGIGLTMSQDKRENFQARPVRKLGKKEIMDLAKRLKIPTEHITREASVQRIIRRIQELNS